MLHVRHGNHVGDMIDSQPDGEDRTANEWEKEKEKQVRMRKLRRDSNLFDSEHFDDNISSQRLLQEEATHQ